MVTNKSIIKLKPYTVKELSGLYGVDWRTIKNWIKPFEHELGEKLGRYYNIVQMEHIFNKLGYPVDLHV